MRGAQCRLFRFQCGSPLDHKSLCWVLRPAERGVYKYCPSIPAPLVFIPNISSPNMQDPAPDLHGKAFVDSLVWRLGYGGLDKWLLDHLPSHLNASSAPLLVTRADSDLRVAESMPDEQTAADETFTNAKQLMNEATANVDQIQKDDAIPVRINSRSTKPSKKQCRDQVQNLFHDQIMLMATDHPLWSQGRWTLILNPQHLDATWTRLVKSFEKGELHAQPSVIALRARHLPASETFGESSHGGQKRKKAASSRSSNARAASSSSSSGPDHERSVAIDVFFRSVWSSEVARSVLQSIAEAGGRMPIFCRASLYSLLGIRSGHPLGNRSTLYNSKAFASPAEANLWTSKHERGDGNADIASASAAAVPPAVGDTASLAEAPPHVPSEPSAHMPSEASVAETAATDPEIHAEAAAEERPPKKVRIDSQPTQFQIKPVEEPTAPAVEQPQHAAQETESTQDELMLPVRPTATSVAHEEAAPSEVQTEKLDLGTTHDKELEPAAANQHKPEPIVQEQESGAAVQKGSDSHISADGKPSDHAAKETFEPGVEQHAKQEPSAEAVKRDTISDKQIEPKMQEESQTQDESMTQIEPNIARGLDWAGQEKQVVDSRLAGQVEEAQPKTPLKPDSVPVAPSGAAVEAAAAETDTLAESHTELPAPLQEKDANAAEAEQPSADSVAASVQPDKEAEASKPEQLPADSAAASVQPGKDVEVSKAEQHAADPTAASTQQQEGAEAPEAKQLSAEGAATSAQPGKDVEVSEAKEHPADSAAAAAEQPSAESETVTKASDASMVVASVETRSETKESVTAILELPKVASVDQKAVPLAKHEDTADKSTIEVEKDSTATASAGDETTAPKQVSEGEANSDIAAAQETATGTSAKGDDAPAKADDSKVAGAEMALEDLIVEAAVAVELAPTPAEAVADKRDDGPASA